MEITTKTPQKIVLRMEANETLANALRRSVSEVLTLAIDEVEIYKNDSALYDEVLAHRLGLVPLKTEKNMNSKTVVEMKLVKEGPCTVYSGDIKGNVEVVYDKIPITILGEGHSIELVASAKLGKGIDHAKHVPALCYYRHLQKVKSSSENDRIVEKSKGLIKPEKKGNFWICDLTEADSLQISEKDESSISDSDELILIIESFEMLESKDVLLKAISALEENLDDFEKSIK
jgi:DNA-directed RNA polymerase subunit D